MATTRLFVAVWPAPSVLDAVAALPRPQVEGVRWTTRPQWHVTLRFFGAVADEDRASLDDAWRRIDLSQVPLPLVASAGPRVGRFGQRVLHVPVAGLDTLAAEVEARTAGVGQPPEPRPFRGHLTLARTTGRRGRAGRVDRLDPGAGSGPAGGPDRGPDLRTLAGAPIDVHWTVSELTLVRSRLGGAGVPARYDIVDAMAL